MTGPRQAYVMVQEKELSSEGERNGIQVRQAASCGAGQGGVAHQSGDHGGARGDGEGRGRGSRASRATDPGPRRGRTAEETAGVRRRRMGTTGGRFAQRQGGGGGPPPTRGGAGTGAVRPRGARPRGGG